ncbi:MAG: DUF962 domain-containing protein [Ferruginibacter sp.]
MSEEYFCNFLENVAMAAEKKYKSFWSFYPYYLTEHGNAKNRLLHFIGTGLIILFLIVGIIVGKWWMIAVIPIFGYGFAWVGHFFIEKNRPATFTYPLYSLASDFVMFWHILTGQLPKKLNEAQQTINTNS